MEQEQEVDLSSMQLAGMPSKKGHPFALWILFGTEFWERFGYYLMVGIFFLFLKDPIAHGGKGFSTKMAADLVGSFIALVYLAPFIGGMMADRYLGYRRAIILGSAMLAAGYYTLAVPGDNTMYIGLLLIIVGNGFFKPNISTLLGNIYNREDLKPKKDVAYNIFYMGINAGAFICNFVAAYMRNHYNWGYAFAAAGVGMTVALIWFIVGMKHLKEGDIKRPLSKEDMPMSKILGYVFLPAIITATLGFFLHRLLGDKLPNIYDHCLFGTASNDAFMFACVPIIIFYIGIYRRAAKGDDKRGLSALFAFFIVSIVFWVIYNQNSTGLTIWADQYTERPVPHVMTGFCKTFGMIEPASTKPDSVTKIDEYFRPVLDAKGKTQTVLGINPYFQNLPKEKWPKDSSFKISLLDMSGHKINSITDETQSQGKHEIEINDQKFNLPSGDYKIKIANDYPKENLISTELFQSINPFFIVLLTPIVLGLFVWLKRRKKEPNTPVKIGMGMVIAGLSSLLMMFAVYSTNIYHNKAEMIWIVSTYALFTLGELLISPIGLSLVSKLSPPRITALMMGCWFLVNAIAGKLAGLMATFWDSFTDKSMYFLILVIAAGVSGVIMFILSKWIATVVREKTGAN